MMKSILETFLVALAAYAASGLCFAVAFHWRGLAKTDPGAAQSGWLFRLLITPGIVALWPLLAIRWHRIATRREFLGNPDAPVAASQLRRWHGVAWKGLAVLLPLVLAAALFGRSRPLPPQTIPAGLSGAAGFKSP